MFLRKACVAAVLACMIAGAAAAQSLVGFAPSRLDVVTAAGGRHPFTVELAETPEQLAQGLMFRSQMAADAGMMFDFGRPRPVTMWMKNTLLPLDMLFIDETGRVTGIHERAIPGSLAVIGSPGPVKSVLELNGGTAQRLGLRVGDMVEHPWFRR
jgi:uncharacterized membrane protein (UPF0127 family)